MRRNLLICFIIQFIGWCILTFSDYLEEKDYCNFNTAVIRMVPLICVVLYTIFRKWIYKYNLPGVKSVAKLCFSWLIYEIIFGISFYMLLNEGLWIVPQATGGWENFLNGVEYIVFAFEIGIFPVAWCILLEATIGIVMLIKARKYKTDESQN